VKALLLCPADHPAAGSLTRQRPVALVPVLGRSLLDLAIAGLVRDGVTEVRVLAVDRPNLVRAATGKGEPWGISVEVVPEREELSVEAALAKHGPAERVVTLALIPGQPDDAWENPAAFYQEIVRRITAETAADRLTMREVAPGVFVSTKARVDPATTLRAPCWIGPHAWVAPSARLEAGCIVEERAYVDDGVLAEASWIGPQTYVGSMTELRNSVAWGNGLLNWRNGSFTEVHDEFLLADLARVSAVAARAGWLGRLAALAVLVLTFPLPLLGCLRARPGSRLPARTVLLAPVTGDPQFARTCVVRELAGFHGLLRRWPELWNIVRGDCCWIGNRPLTPGQAAQLTDDFERLWLAVPAGLFSLADVHDTAAEFDDDARVHAAFYAAHRSRREDLHILTQALRRILRH